jgi:hypothetical protein
MPRVTLAKGFFANELGPGGPEQSAIPRVRVRRHSGFTESDILAGYEKAHVIGSSHAGGGTCRIRACPTHHHLRARSVHRRYETSSRRACRYHGNQSRPQSCGDCRWRQCFQSDPAAIRNIDDDPDPVERSGRHKCAGDRHDRSRCVARVQHWTGAVCARVDRHYQRSADVAEAWERCR